MCSIFGIISFKNECKDILKNKIDIMACMSKYRGPDQSNVIIFENAAIGMNRLSIIAPNENSTIHKFQEKYSVFNGEISNYKELLSLIDIESKCDSSIILPLFEKYGQDFIHKLAGMFSIALYDNNKKTIQLWRDHLGVKPLYYHFSNDYFIFASEIKMIYAVMNERPTINVSAIDHILKYRFEPGNTTIFNEIHKVLPGETVLINKGKLFRNKYWSLKNNLLNDDKNCSIEEFRDLFEKVISENTNSDVNGGFFTSGGLDSSLITAVALNQKNSMYTQPISIKFSPNSAIDESYGKKLEHFFDKQFEWVTISDDLARNTLEELIPFLDEPLENPTHIGTYLMSKRAKELGIKTIITGDGSDELFLGYERQACWFTEKKPYEKYPDLCYTMKKDESSEIYTHNALDLLKPIINGDNKLIEPILNINDALMFERLERLPEYHNMRLDRMTMANSIEARVPFLDKRIIEYSLKLSHSTLYNKIGKSWLKKVAEKWLPSDIIYRKKVLFPSMPNQWISGNGIAWASDILLDKNAKISEIINQNIVHKYIMQHDEKKQFRGRLIWALVTLELWLNNIDNWRI